MTGAFLQAAAENRVILVDGFIVCSALLVAARINPLVLQRCIFAHKSGERGHALMLQALATPSRCLNWACAWVKVRAQAVAWPLLQSACAIINNMASFAQAGVAQS